MDTTLHADSDAYAHVHHRIAEHVSRDLGVDVSAADVTEILTAKTIGWPDGVVPAVQAEAREYGIFS